ncbi:MAG TPA: LytR family transcriptional regulator, partial [Candidatus Aveggerthella excrementigallinarum]|nr:LytR family transcriptional regulator [Candidatus Aveggerthella excrementigallinarum]
MPATDFNSIEELIAAARGRSIHIECGREAGRRALEAVRSVYGKARVAYYVEGDRGFSRDTVRSYLRFFSALAGGSITAEEAIAHFGLKAVARTRIEKLSPEQRALMNLARLTLFEPEVVFCERPLAELGVDARHTVLAWMGTESERGTVFVTVCEPLR